MQVIPMRLPSATPKGDQYLLLIQTRSSIIFLKCVFQVWAWKENVWEKEKGTLMERYTVEQSKPQSQGGAVLSTLTINNVMESDFHSPYNCTAWNSFGPGTMIITLEETGMEREKGGEIPEIVGVSGRWQCIIVIM